ncbi:MAG: hypothetical protein HY040_10350 [Planctomycetes bacterium]|nr:hypothetical protein [Planctomycetota bacterium]
MTEPHFSQTSQSRRTLPAVLHYLVTLVFAVWLGGFTFYALVVVPTGHQVLKSKMRQGFITQQVTNQLNVLGVAALSLLLWQMLAVRQRAGSRGGSRTAWLSWTVLALTLAALFWIHPRLDTMLDPVSRSVADDDRFYEWHRWYLVVATMQWMAAVVHLATLIGKQGESPPTAVRSP